ncbi:pentapeptide repeat-containing protein [Rothia mucilaginosa]|uniref:pentapeptide repeat-containing protein n=1 Tax=Rothia mucilaginosa TaxID=43675 RepID=UPI0028DD1ADC|nr:pentapeptide repeat-containing protein [Rothia mucilaginosa]
MPSNNTSSAPENPVIPKAQEKPWYIQHFTKLLIGFGLGGGAVAVLLPWMLWWHCGMSSGSSDQLRLHLLYVTGGIIAVLTLLQTNWKNQGDRLKIDADIKKNEQDAEKNERDHIRQVHAERRSRYTKAVEQLADEKATVRLGGIYTLTGLVDEWLADDSLTKEKQQEEGQVIINNLCSYIRSPFPLAEKIEEYEARKALENLQKLESEKLDEELSSRLQNLLKRFKDSDEYEKPKDITADYAKFHEEQDVRRAIFVEMSKRSSTFTMNEKDEIIETISGMWSDFDFDFGRAPVFYPLNAITIEKGNFSSTKFYSNADFSEAKFTQTADFSWTTFAQTADFGGAKFTQKADFSGAKFARTAHFSWTTFAQKADFSWAKFTQTVYFSKTKFTQKADFRGAKFARTAYFKWAKFFRAADFGRAKFTQTADFSEAKFFRAADFGRAKFFRTADFGRAEFTRTADFRGAIFFQNANFSRATFEKYSPRFATTTHGVSGEAYRARFAALSEKQPAHDFAVREDSRPILLGETELGNIKYNIPMGAILFDPYSWDEEKKEYTRVSKPAK